MSEGPDPVGREWQRALGLQDCMVLVGGRLDIPDFEPIPITNDTMSSAVEILWSRPRPGSFPPSGASHSPRHPGFNRQKAVQQSTGQPHASASENQNGRSGSKRFQLSRTLRTHPMPIFTR